MDKGKNDVSREGSLLERRFASHVDFSFYIVSGENPLYLSRTFECTTYTSDDVSLRYVKKHCI